MQSTIDSSKAHVSGFVAPGFEEVRAEFERNFAERGEIGAAVAAYWRGEKVVDLWGGRRTPEGDAPWNEDTMVVVMSSTKGLAAMTLAVANARGWLDYDAPVARYWPEFAQNGKAAITVRQLLGHEAGLVLLDEKLTYRADCATSMTSRVCSRARSRRGRRARATATTRCRSGCTCRSSFAASTPRTARSGASSTRRSRCRWAWSSTSGCRRRFPTSASPRSKTLSTARALLALPSTPPAMLKKMLPAAVAAPPVDSSSRISTGTIGARSRWSCPRATAWVRRARSRAPIPRSPKAAPSSASRRKRSPASPRRPRSPSQGRSAGCADLLLARLPAARARRSAFGSSPRAFGAPGAGGSFAFADPDARLGYAYVMNKLDFYLHRRSAREGAARRGVPRDPPGRAEPVSIDSGWNP